MVTVCRIGPEDLPGLKFLYEDSFENSSSDIKRMKEVYDQIKDNPNYIILCAKTDKKIIGSLTGIVCNELFGKCRPFMVVENVAVLKEYRRTGIAKKLMIKLEEIAVQYDCSMIMFVSSSHRTGAHKLYESLEYGKDKVNGYRKRLG